MVMEPVFGRSEVESRLNMSHKEQSHYHTLECVASTEDEEAYTLFSISGMIALSHTQLYNWGWSYLCACTAKKHKHTNPLTLGLPRPGV